MWVTGRARCRSRQAACCREAREMRCFVRPPHLPASPERSRLRLPVWEVPNSVRPAPPENQNRYRTDMFTAWLNVSYSPFTVGFKFPVTVRPPLYAK